MGIKNTKWYLHKLEDLMAESPYILRYEKGNFKSGYCILKTKKVAMVNKYFSDEGKISCLIDIIKSIELEPDELSDKNKILYSELLQMEINL